MTAVPPDVERLLEERVQARASRDFARADAIREEIAALGFAVRDTPGGATVEPIAAYTPVEPAAVPNLIDQPGTVGFSIHLLYEGFREDVRRFLDAAATHLGAVDHEIVLVDNASDDAKWLEELASERVHVLHLDRAVGYAEARNAGLKTGLGRIVVLADLSVEPTGDLLSPLRTALDDPAVGVAGPWGIVSEDMREFTASDGPEVDAIEGYLLATPRELLARGLVHEKFRWYRHADIDLSFQLRDLGTRAVVVPVPAVKHTHRGWAALSEDERTKRSKRNWNIFFDRWKHRHTLLLSHRG